MLCLAEVTINFIRRIALSRCPVRMRAGRFSFNPEDGNIMSTATPVYFIESVSTNQFSRYTLEVYREEDGQYRLIQRRWNNRLNLVDQESHVTASSLDDLRSMDLRNKRLVRMLKNSDFWRGNDA